MKNAAPSEPLCPLAESGSKLKNWLFSQRLGLAARMVRSWKGVPDRGDLYVDAFDSLAGFLHDLDLKDCHRLCMLSPSALRGILALSHTDLPEPFNVQETYSTLRNAIMGALSHLLAKEGSIYAKAMSVAHHIMAGSGSSKRLLRFAEYLFDSSLGWKRMRTSSSADRFDQVLAALRSPNRLTSQRFANIAELYDLMPDDIEREHVCAILVSNAFCQPLLVVGAAAISIPIAFDVDVPAGGVGDLHVIGDTSVSVDFHETGAKPWRKDLSLAREAAIRLYRKSHLHLGPVGALLRHAIVKCDLSLASLIIEGIIPSAMGIRSRLHIEGGSAGATVAQFILAQLHGRQWYLSSSITGAIGNRIEYPGRLPGQKRRALDHSLNWVEGLDAKLQATLDAGIHDRVVLPDDPRAVSAVNRIRDSVDPAENYRLLAPPVPEFVFARTLSTVADIVQVGGWRTNALIRCPEIEWHLFATRQGASGPLPRNDPYTQAALDACGFSESSIVNLGSSSSPLGVASALTHLNRDIRTTYGRYGPPSLSWLLIRTVNDEADASFWNVVWKAVGGSADDFALFRDSPTREIAAAQLARTMNNSDPNTFYERGQCAPDVIVIAGPNRLNAAPDSDTLPSLTPLDPLPLLDYLDQHQLLDLSKPRRRRSDVFEPRIGRTRFITVEEAEEPVSTAWPPVHSELLRLLQGLSIFRFGFTLSMANLLCRGTDFDGPGLRGVLEDLKTSKLLREALGRYHIPTPLHRRFQQQHPTLDPDLLADLHHRAGIALAPYVVSVPVSSLAFDRALAPWAVREAAYHLQEADSLRVRMSDQGASNVIRSQMQMLAKFSAAPTWELVSWLNRGRHGALALEVATELMEGWRQHPGNTKGIPPHPVHYARRITSRAYIDPRKLDLLGAVERDVEDGLAACEWFPEAKEAGTVRLLVNYSLYLFKAAAFMPELMAKWCQTNLEVDKLRHAWPAARIRAEWFETRADWEIDAQVAHVRYCDGIEFAPKWAQNWLKALGTARILRLDLQPLLVKFRTLNPEARSALVDGMDRGADALVRRISSGRAKRPSPPQLLEVIERWRQGLRAMIDESRSDQHLRNRLNAMLNSIEHALRHTQLSKKNTTRG